MARFIQVDVINPPSSWGPLYLNLAWVKTAETADPDEILLTYWNGEQITVKADERLLAVLSDG